MYADLHIHSIYSDGQKKIPDICKIAKERGLQVIAVTDHDGIDGIKEIFKYKNDIEIITGIELTVSNKVHILGYFFDENNMVLKDKLNKLKMKRAVWIIRLVNELGENYDISVKKMLSVYGEITLYSVTNYLVSLKDLGWDKNEVYRQFFKDGRKGFKCGKYPCFELEEAVEVIKAAKGIPILAHPGLLLDNSVNINDTLDKLVEKGICGIEVYHIANYNLGLINTLTEYAKDRNLLMTGGSDYHGKKNKKTNIGEFGLDTMRWEQFVKNAQIYLSFKQRESMLF